MCPRMTNHQWVAHDASSFSFESAGGLAFANECSGSAVPPARYIAFAERQLDLSRLIRLLSLEVSLAHPPMQEFAAFVGIDWADTTHAVCLQVAGSDTRETRVLAHTPEAISTWACTLRHRFGGQPIAVCLELTKGPLVSALRAHDFLVLFPVHALTVATYREAFTPSRAKDDPSDAELQLELLLKHRDKLQMRSPQSATMRTRDQRVEFRRRLVEDKVRLTNRLTSALKHDFPQVLHWFSDKDTTIFCDVLSQWPTLKAIHLARRATLERFVRQHHVQTRLIAQRMEAIQTAIPLTTDEGVITPHVCLVRALGAQLRATLQASEDFDHAIAPLAPTHPDFALLQALPGAGPVFAPRLLVAFGAQRDRDASATDLQQYAGIAPVTERSGNTCGVHWRLQCPKFLRQTFVEWARESLRHSFWARAYYAQPRAKGRTHQAATRALAFTWIRILYCCWQTKTPYDETTYLNALVRRGSPLIRHVANVP
jgi:transposase